MLKKVDQNYLEWFETLNEEGWRRSVGLICEKKQGYKESRRKGISYIQ